MTRRAKRAVTPVCVLVAPWEPRCQGGLGGTLGGRSVAANNKNKIRELGAAVWIARSAARLRAPRATEAEDTLSRIGAESFVCPTCRFRAMDPLNRMLDGGRGVLKQFVLRPPLLPKTATSEASLKFQLNLPRIKEWRKAGHNVEVRMCRLDSYKARGSSLTYRLPLA